MSHYFSPGPASLPHEVRTRIHNELLDTFGIGVSIMEISHRSKFYEELNDETLRLGREVFNVPTTHSVLFTPFGAQQHFALVLHHLSLPGETVAYTDTGNWANLAVADAHTAGRNVVLSFDGKLTEYKNLGNTREWNVPKEAKYLHLTVNNTVCGTEYQKIPDHFSVPLVLDMTSAIGARSDIPWDKTALIYASAQKNFGIAGASVVIVRNDVLEASKETIKKNKLGNALSYHSIFAAKSVLNTPPVFPLYAANRMMQWMKSVGGLAEMERRALQKASLIYNEVDAGFYKGRADRPVRSRHNFVFCLPTKELDELFIQEAAYHKIIEIKGYRSVGGIRASAYNGVSVESTEVLANFMKEFRKKHG